MGTTYHGHYLPWALLTLDTTHRMALWTLLLQSLHTMDLGCAVYLRAATMQAADAERFAHLFADCAVYRGGPDGADEPGICLHGIADLDDLGERDQSTREITGEIAPGLAVYACSVAGALDAVSSGRAFASDFRLFLGHQVKHASTTRIAHTHPIWQHREPDPSYVTRMA